MDVAIVGCRQMPRPDADDEPLHAALAAAGVSSRTVAWEDENFDWSSPRAAIVRSTWNYVQNFEAFLAWAARCAAQTKLYNPLSVMRWNSHKGYLLELARQGLPVVPTRLLRRGSSAVLTDIVGSWTAVVLKPAVSAGSFGTARCDATDWTVGQAHLDQFLPRCDMLVQPYVPSVDGAGERCLVWIDGVLTHAVRKAPRFRARGNVVSEPVPIAPDEAACANRMLAAVPSGESLLYARIDLVRDRSGQPVLMELELIEPSLFLVDSPLAAARLASAVARRIA